MVCVVCVCVYGAQCVCDVVLGSVYDSVYSLLAIEEVGGVPYLILEPLLQKLVL